jgi:hypothetical protein
MLFRSNVDRFPASSAARPLRTQALSCLALRELRIRCMSTRRNPRIINRKKSVRGTVEFAAYGNKPALEHRARSQAGMPARRARKEFAMSAIGFMSSSVLEALLSRSTQTGTNNFKQAFQKLGQDLQSGNIAGAETDLATLQTNTPLQPSTGSHATSSSSSGIVSQAFNQIAQDLQSGNLSAAQTDYAGLQQDLKQGNHVFHHHLHGTGSTGNLSQAQQALTQLGQALQSGNVSGAQQAYASLQTDLPGLMFANSTSGSGTTASSGSGLNLSV